MARDYDFDVIANDAAADDDDIFTLFDGVGPRRRNRRADVLKVETLLANAGHHDLAEGPTGYAGADLDAAIRAYQKRRNLAVDGVLEPAGETITTLEGELRPRFRGFRSPRPGEADEHFNRVGRGDAPLFEVAPRPPVLHDIPGLPEIDGGAWQSNGRTARALFQTRDNGALADLAADAIESDGIGGVAEVRDLLDQIRARDPKRSDAMARAVFDHLQPKNRLLFTGGDQPEGEPIGVMQFDRPQLDQIKNAQEPTSEPRDVPDDRRSEPEQAAADDDVSRPAPNPIPRPTVRTQYQQKVYDDPINNPPGTLERFNGAAARQPGASDASVFALGEKFIVEGGRRDDPESSASSGLLQRDLDRAKANEWTVGLQNVATPSDLSDEQRAALMHRYLDEELKHSHPNGIKALEEIGNHHAAAALADTLYRHGGPKGGRTIQEAINAVNKQIAAETPGSDPRPQVKADGRVGPVTIDAFGELARDPKTRGALLDALAEKRKGIREIKERDYPRIDYFRYRDER